MRDRRTLEVVATLVLAATLAACDSSASSQSGPTSTTSSTSGTSLLNDNSSITFAPRPRDLSLAGVDPCVLITSSQQSQLQIRPGVHATPDSILFKGSPICSFPLGIREPGLSYSIESVTTQGIQYYLDPTLADTLKQVTIAGYPALDLTAKFSSTQNWCGTVVSVADGQMFDVHFAPRPGTPNTEACTQTETVAAAAVATLQTLKK